MPTTNNISALLAAAARGDIGEIDKLLATGVNVNAYLETIDPDLECLPRSTAVMVAARYGQFEALKHLIAKGGNPHQKNSADQNTFHACITSNIAGITKNLDKIAIMLIDDPQTETKLLTPNIYENSNTKKVDASLYYAAKNGLSGTVSKLLLKQVPTNITVMDHIKPFLRANDTRIVSDPLKAATLGGYATIVKILLDAGVETMPSETSTTALEFAAEHATSEVILLLTKHLNGDLVEVFCNVTKRYEFNFDAFHGVAEQLNNYNACDKDGVPLLFYVIATGSEKAVRYFISKGADPHKIDNNGCNAVGRAATVRSLPILKLFVETYKIEVNILYTHSNRYTKACSINPLYAAVMNINAEIVSYLAPLTSDINQVFTNNDGTSTTVLIEACRNDPRYAGAIETIAALINNKANVLQAGKFVLCAENIDKKVEIQMTPFRAAALQSNFKALLELCSVVNMNSYEPNHTALRDAIKAHIDEPFYTEIYHLGTPIITETSIFALACAKNRGIFNIIDINTDDIRLALINRLLELKCTGYNAIINDMPIIAHAIDRKHTEVVRILAFTKGITLGHEFKYEYSSDFTTTVLNCNLVTLPALLHEEAMLKIIVAALSPEIAKNLANVRIDSTGQTMLMKLVSKKHPNLDVIKCLVNAGADVAAQDNDGKTALDYVTDSSNSHRAIIKFLTYQLQPPAIQFSGSKSWGISSLSCTRSSVQLPESDTNEQPARRQSSIRRMFGLSS